MIDIFSLSFRTHFFRVSPLLPIAYFRFFFFCDYDFNFIRFPRVPRTRVHSAAVPERKVRAEDPVPGPDDGRAVSRRPAATTNGDHARVERPRRSAATDHRSPLSVRRLTRRRLPSAHTPLVFGRTYCERRTTDENQSKIARVRFPNRKPRVLLYIERNYRRRIFSTVKPLCTLCADVLAFRFTLQLNIVIFFFIL